MGGWALLPTAYCELPTPSIDRYADKRNAHLVRRFLAPFHGFRRAVRVARIGGRVVVVRRERQLRAGGHTDRLLVAVRALPVEVPVLDVDQALRGTARGLQLHVHLLAEQVHVRGDEPDLEREWGADRELRVDAIVRVVRRDG